MVIYWFILLNKKDFLQQLRLLYHIYINISDYEGLKKLFMCSQYKYFAAIT